jgi:hypothetical protein
MLASKSLNVFKYTDYGDPVVFQKTDYRSANQRAHRFTLSTEKKFIPAKSHVLCDEIKYGLSSYHPTSESAKEFSWKINSKRNHHEDLAPHESSVRYLHQFTDKIKASGSIIPLNLCRSGFTDIPPFTTLPKEPRTKLDKDPKIGYQWRGSQYTHTDGYFPQCDLLLSTTQLDFHMHPNYSTARTNLIVRKELPFNSDRAYFIPNSKLIRDPPFTQKYSCLLTKDDSKFSQKTFDRIVPFKSSFVENFGLTTEASSNF